jgi:hypothetical protein
MIAFIDDHRDVHGVEPICEVLPIAPSTYRAHAAAWRDPEKSSAKGLCKFFSVNSERAIVRSL